MQRLTINTSSREQRLFTSCLLECAARKPGNVHPQAAFAGTSFADFVRSAHIAAPLLAQAGERGVGAVVLAAVRERVAAGCTNTNLGILMLLAPLAAVPEGQKCGEGIEDVLRNLDEEDARDVYEAIRLAAPGGLGEVSEHDVREPPRISLREAMQLACDRDLVARQYASGFEEVLGPGRAFFLQALDRDRDWEGAIIETQLRLLAAFPDSLIARKCGDATAAEASRRAEGVLAEGDWQTAKGRAALGEFDQWLRGEGNRRNPGTTADLIAAVLYSTLHDGTWQPPQEIVIDTPAP